jgi:hypothetical protein
MMIEAEEKRKEEEAKHVDIRKSAIQSQVWPGVTSVLEGDAQNRGHRGRRNRLVDKFDVIGQKLFHMWRTLAAVYDGLAESRRPQIPLG